MKSRFIFVSAYYVFINIISTLLFFIIYIFFNNKRNDIIEIGYILQFYYLVSNGLNINLFSKLDRYNPKEIILFSLKYRILFLLILTYFIFFLTPVSFNIIYFIFFFLIGITYFESFPQYLNLEKEKFKIILYLKIFSLVFIFIFFILSKNIIITYLLFILLNHSVTFFYLYYIYNKLYCKTVIKINLFPTIQGFITFMYTSFLILANKNVTVNWEIFGIVDKIYNTGINLFSPNLFAMNINLIKKEKKFVFVCIFLISLFFIFLLYVIQKISIILLHPIIFNYQDYIYIFMMINFGLIIPQLVYVLNYFNKEKFIFLIILLTGLVNIPLFFVKIPLAFRLIMNSFFVLSGFLILIRRK
jgi:hypothetical protein